MDYGHLLIALISVLVASLVTLAGARVYQGGIAKNTIELLNAGLEAESQARQRDKAESDRKYMELKENCGHEVAELRGRVAVLTTDFAERLIKAVVEGFDQHRGKDQGG